MESIGINEKRNRLSLSKNRMSAGRIELRTQSGCGSSRVVPLDARQSTGGGVAHQRRNVGIPPELTLYSTDSVVPFSEHDTEVVEKMAVGAAETKLHKDLNKAADVIDGGDASKAVQYMFGGGEKRSLSSLLAITVAYLQNAGSIVAMDVEWPSGWLGVFGPLYDLLSFRITSIAGFGSQVSLQMARIFALLLPVYLVVIYFVFYEDRKLTTKWDFFFGRITALGFFLIPALVVGGRDRRASRSRR